jgi:GTP-binding protein EngB required for normal cell division
MKVNYTLRAELDAIVSEFGALARVLEAGRALERVVQQLAKLNEGVFRVAVVGEIKKGKSSLINALLGIDGLAPTASDVATSTVYKLRYGSVRRAVIHFAPNFEETEGGSREIPAEPARVVPIEELPQWGTEDGNPRNRKHVAFIEIEEPSPWLQRGLEIIDTPGLGGLFKQHAQITWTHVPTADAVFFVLDSVEAVMSADELAFLRRLLPITTNITFFQTKTDLVNPEQWQAWRDRNLELISETMGKPKEAIPYFPISSKLKQTADLEKSERYLKRSGFIDVNQHLSQDMLGQKESALSRQVLTLVRGESQSLRRRLSDAVILASAESQHQLENLDAELKAAFEQQEQWERSVYRNELERLRDNLADLRRRTQADLTQRLEPSPTGPIVSEIMRYFRDREIPVNHLNDHVSEVQSACVDKCAEVVFSVQKRFNQDAEQLIRATIHALSAGLAESRRRDTQDIVLTKPSVQLASDLGLRSSQGFDFDEIKHSFFGLSVGSSMATLVAGVIAMIFPLGFLAPLLAGIGGWFGFQSSREGWERKRRDEALAKLQQLLVDTVSKARFQAQQQFEDIAIGFERQSRDILAGAVDEMRAAIKARKEELSATKTRSRADSQTRIAGLRGDLGRVEAILTRCQAAMGA